MSYNILRTDKANDQLFDVIQYIADNAGANIALQYLDKLEVAVINLADFPYSGTVPRYSILKKQGYRVLIVERHLTFYKVDEEKQTVMIHAVVDGRQEYRNLV